MNADRQSKNRKPDNRRISDTNRFTAFAFCWGDVLLECDDQLNIRFAAGATPALFGEESRNLVGQNLHKLLDEPSHAQLGDSIRTMGENGRVGPLSVRLSNSRPAPLSMEISGYRVSEFNDHIFLAMRHQPRTTNNASSADEMRTESGLFKGDAFAQMAANKFASKHEETDNAQVSLVKVQNLDELRENTPPVTLGHVMNSVSDILRRLSVNGDAAGTWEDGAFGLVHDESVNVSDLVAEIEEKTRENFGDDNGLSVETATIDPADCELSAQEMAKALSFAMSQFAKGGEKLLADTDPQTLFRKMTQDTTQTASTFRRICQTRDFNFAFMPIVDIESGAVSHFEALTRFKHFDDMGLNTYEVIRIAEEVGLIHDFDLAVAHKAVSLINQNALNEKFKPLAINISGASITDKTFLREFKNVLDRVNNVSKLLIIEITESAAISDLPIANACVQELREQGFRVALDDFGAGAASFDYLNAFEVDIVKFDGPVVQRAISTPRGRAFLASVAKLCADTGVETVAEMVEDESQVQTLIECGIKYGQGYHFGKPAADLPDL